MNRKLITLVLAAAVATSPLMAKKHKGGMDGFKDDCCHEAKQHRKMFEPERLQKLLSLTPEQIEKIRKINDDYRKRVEALRAELEPQHETLRQELLAENVNLEKIRAVMKASSDKMIDMRMLRIEHRLEIEKILSPEQKKKWREHHREMMQKYKQQQSDD